MKRNHDHHYPPTDAATINGHLPFKFPAATLHHAVQTPAPSLTLLSPSFAMAFTKIFDVQAHGNTVLTVVYTNDVDTVEAYVNDYKDILQGRKEKIVGIDVEYTRDKKRPALIQLSIGKDDTVLLFQVCATFEQRCPAFDKFLANPK